MSKLGEKVGGSLVGRRLDYLEDAVFSLRGPVDRNAMLLGRMNSRAVRAMGVVSDLREAEFKVFSQGGEDGIIQYLLGHVRVENDMFVEFGVEDYREANTRFLMMQDNWRGLVLDGSEENVRRICAQPYHVHFDLRAKTAMVTAENINELLKGEGIGGDIGLLSVDIDGNDYWVWKAITGVVPRIVICEYNSLFGPSAAVTVPYDSAFVRSRAHSSMLYFGASLSALTMLAEQKGYVLVGSNSVGSNAFFVRKDVLDALKPVQAEQAWRESRFTEARDANGKLSFVRGRDRLDVIRDLPVVDVVTGKTTSVGVACGRG